MDYAIIVAGGSGTRMGCSTPKQFLELEGKPILMHTISRFHQALSEVEIIVVLPKSHLAIWHELCQQHRFSIQHQTVHGGPTRYDSVKNGLSLIPVHSQNAVVGIHDGVRPFVSQEVIQKCYQTAHRQGTAIPALPSIESVRYSTDFPNSSQALDRSRCWMVQTPQVFQTVILQQAYSIPYRDTFTDDASVVEAAGMTVTLVEGNKENIKLTSPFDLLVANAILSSPFHV